MNSGRTVFSQLIDFLPAHQFSKCVARYNGDGRVRTFTCWESMELEGMHWPILCDNWSRPDPFPKEPY
jgi:hypothetical protein